MSDVQKAQIPRGVQLTFSAAGFLLWRARCWRARYVLPAILLTVSLVYCTLAYIDQNWFFNILLDSFMGIWYPICVLLTFGDLLYRYRRDAEPPLERPTELHPATANEGK